MSILARFKNFVTSIKGMTGAAVGGVGAGSSSGSPYADAFGRNRAPTPIELAREWLNTAYACSVLNANLVASTTPRLYVKTTRRNKRSRLIERGVTKSLSSFDLARLKASPGSAAHVQNAQNVEEVLEHPLLDLLQHPSGEDPAENGAGMTAFTLFNITQLYQEVIGYGYWYVEREGLGGTPSSLWALPAYNVQEIPDLTGDRVIAYYSYTGYDNGRGLNHIPVEQMVPFRFPSLVTAGYSGGYPPLRACFEQVKVFRYLSALIAAQLQQGGKPSAVWSPAGEGSIIGRDEATRMRLAFRQAFAAQNAGGVMIAESPGKLDLLNWPANQVITPEQFDSMKVQVANCYQVPTTKLDRNDANRASALTGDYAHAKDAGLPRLRGNEAAINCFLIPMYPGGRDQLFVAYDEPEGLRDPELEEKQWSTALTTGSATRGEYRERMRLPKEKWAEQPLAPANMEPVDDGGVHFSLSADKVAAMPDQQPPEPPPEQKPDTTTVAALQQAYYGKLLPRDAAIANAQLTLGIDPTAAAALFPEEAPDAPQAEPAPGEEQPVQAGAGDAQDQQQQSYEDIYPAGGGKGMRRDDGEQPRGFRDETLKAGQFDEAKHPRAEGGKFGETTGGVKPAKGNPRGAVPGERDGVRPAKRTTQQEPRPSAKSVLAKRSMVITDRNVQRYSEEFNEPFLAKKLGGLSFRDNEAVDIVLGDAGVVNHGIEMKTIVRKSSGQGRDTGGAKITMKGSAMARKAQWRKDNGGASFSTVVFDDRNVYDAKGPGQHDPSKRVILFRRGFGSFRTENMLVVKGYGHLKKLLAMKDSELPDAAKPPAHYGKPAKYFVNAKKALETADDVVEQLP